MAHLDWQTGMGEPVVLVTDEAPRNLYFRGWEEAPLWDQLVPLEDRNGNIEAKAAARKDV